MSSTTSKVSWIICDKSIGQFKYEGCLQTFCTKHVSQQLDEVIFEHDSFQQTIIEAQNPNHRLMVYIEQWEEKSIDKIRQTAKEVCEKVNQLKNTQKEILTKELTRLKIQMKKACEDDDFFETDLRNWLSMLEKLKQELKTASLSKNIKENRTLPLVHQIQIFPLSSDIKPFEINQKNRSIAQHYCFLFMKRRS